MFSRIFDLAEKSVASFSELSPSNALVSLVIVAGVLILWTPSLNQQQDSRRTKQGSEDSQIPNAPGGIPLLGHALSYKKNPPECLRSIQSQVGSIFRLNLAGRRMIVIGATSDEHITRQISMANDSILSSHQAIADIGFEIMLGHDAVHDRKLHKVFVKEYLQNNNNNYCAELSHHLDRAIEIELKQQQHSDGRIDDLFAFVRRCVIRVILDGLVGRAVLHDIGTSLIDDIIVFEDALEEATAKAAVLPRFIADPVVLRPIQKLRERLQRRIEYQMQAFPSFEKGPYLQVVRDKPLHVQSEMIVSLIFAAHKNPSIAAAQTICFAMDNASCRQESMSFKKRGLNIAQSDLTDCCPTIRRYVLETLRTTAHSIGSLRKVQDDYTITTDSGSKLQLFQGEVIAASHLLTNTDEKRWKNALSFDPKRYTDEQVKTMRFDAPYVTFSSGIHKCPGETIGVTLISLVVAHLLSRDVRLQQPLPEISFARATLAQRAKPVAVRLNA